MRAKTGSAYYTRHNNMANEFRAGQREAEGDDGGRGRRHSSKLKMGGVGVGACECGNRGKQGRRIRLREPVDASRRGVSV